MANISHAYINPEILKWARKESGFSLEEAAKSGVSSNKIEKAERGEELLTFKQLIKIANKYKRPPSFFYLEKPPKEDLLSDFRTLVSRDVKYSPLLRDKIKKIREKRQFAIEYKYYDRDYSYEFINSIDKNEDPEDVSERIREFLNINMKVRNEWKNKYEAFNYWKTQIERLGILIFQLSNIEVEEMRGFSISEVPYPVIALNRGDNVLGRIFTLIHELCHIMVNKGGICTAKKRDEKEFEIERFCNAVAGATLVPKNELLNHKIVKGHPPEWTDKELKSLVRTFWGSKEVILRRLLILEKTYKDHYQTKREKWKTKISRDQGGGPSPYRKTLTGNSKNYIKMVLNAMYDGKITMQDASYYLGLKLKHFKTLEKNL